MAQMAETVRVVVQARMNSSRLPGKIVAPLAGRPMLAHVVRRLEAAGRFTLEVGSTRWEVLVATSTARDDGSTQDLCRELRVACFRGPEDDVLARYVEASEDLADDDLVVRATADNPLYCLRRTASIVAEHLRTAADYTCIENLSYVVPEVMRAGALRAMARLATDAHCREHVTPFFRLTPDRFRVRQLPPSWKGLRPAIRLTVDTQAEHERMAWIFERLAVDGPLFSLDDVYALCDGHGTLETCATECYRRSSSSAR
jgi:spore coat polysaccharide biosynthesis protein SpsF (cytidylyltransferase family)